MPGSGPRRGRHPEPVASGASGVRERRAGALWDLHLASPCWLANSSLVRLVFWVLLLQVEFEMSRRSEVFRSKSQEYGEFQDPQ